MDNRKYEGTGLGLSIIKQLVAKMNGKITLNSTPNKGSVFKIIFKNIKFDNNKLKYVENIKIDTELIQFEESTVLIVDDIKINRDLLISYMSEFKINVIEANNGQKALDCIKNYNPDLVYIGLNLPYHMF